ncbi:MAG: hypothetical protein AB7L92_00405 [Alphaproteobacteria bacterium]
MTDNLRDEFTVTMQRDKDMHLALRRTESRQQHHSAMPEGKDTVLISLQIAQRFGVNMFLDPAGDPDQHDIPRQQPAEAVLRGPMFEDFFAKGHGLSGGFDF